MRLVFSLFYLCFRVKFMNRRVWKLSCFALGLPIPPSPHLALYFYPTLTIILPLDFPDSARSKASPALSSVK
jgi:hypothetical protein